MLSKLKLAVLLFFHPKSPASIWVNPLSIFRNLLARGLNIGLKLGSTPSAETASAHCNICGWRGKKFGYTAAVSARNFRGDELCLACNSNPRTRELINVLGNQIDLQKAALTIADIGAAACTRKFFSDKSNITYMNVDCFKTSDVVSDITDIKLGDDSVDIVLCCHVLEHIIDFEKGISEIYRILKPGGQALIAVPQTVGLDKTKKIMDETFLGYGHIWDPGDDYHTFIEGVGFTVTPITRQLKPGMQQIYYLSVK